MKIEKGVRKRVFYPPGIKKKKEQNSYTPLVLYTVLSINKILLEKQGNRFSIDLCLLKIYYFALETSVVSCCK